MESDYTISGSYVSTREYIYHKMTYHHCHLPHYYRLFFSLLVSLIFKSKESLFSGTMGGLFFDRFHDRFTLLFIVHIETLVNVIITNIKGGQPISFVVYSSWTLFFLVSHDLIHFFFGQTDVSSYFHFFSRLRFSKTWNDQFYS